MVDIAVGMKKGVTPLIKSVTAALGMCIFALFIHTDLPIRLLSVCGLCLTLFILFLDLRNAASPFTLLGFNKYLKPMAVYTVF